MLMRRYPPPTSLAATAHDRLQMVRRWPGKETATTRCRRRQRSLLNGERLPGRVAAGRAGRIDQAATLGELGIEVAGDSLCTGWERQPKPSKSSEIRFFPKLFTKGGQIGIQECDETGTGRIPIWTVIEWQRNQHPTMTGFGWRQHDQFLVTEQLADDEVVRVVRVWPQKPFFKSAFNGTVG